jgi:hypothetical protein
MLPVQVRPPGAASYGLVVPEAVMITNGVLEPTLRLPGGVRYRVFAARSSDAGFGEVVAGEKPVTAVEFQTLCRLRVRVAPPRGLPHEVRVLCRRREGEQEVLAQGWSVVSAAPGIVDVPLPTGTYRLSVLDGAREGPSRAWTFERAGSQAEVELSPP